MAGAMIYKIKSYLKTLNLHYVDSWLEECINYYQADNPTISENQLREEVSQQWLLSNLRDFKVGIFPPNIKGEHKIVLQGKYAVQVETLIDSGQTRYSQLLALRNQESENIKTTAKPQEFELTSRRCITMTITDGVQELSAMEYQQIPSLKVNDPDLPPGFKMLIKGPVICRKGMLLLGPENVEILGGEVDVLIEKNKYESLLLYTLGLKENEGLKAKPAIVATSDIPTMLDDEDDILMALDCNEGNPADINNTLNDDISFHSIPENLNEVPKTSNEKVKSCEQARKQKSISEYLIGGGPKTHHQFEEMDIEIVEPEPSKVVDTEPFAYLSQIDLTSIHETAIYKFKAIILTLNSRISVHNDEFTLEAKISDGSLSMDVQFASDILESMLDMSPSEMKAMAKHIKRDSALGERLKKTFSSVQEKLISLDCLFYIEFNSKSNLPKVVKLEEVCDINLQKLKARQLNSSQKF